MGIKTSLRRTTTVRLCWAKLAFHNCLRAFIVSEAQKNVFRTKHMEWIISAFRVFVFTFPVLRLVIFQFFAFLFRVFVFPIFRFFESYACGAVPIYFNGADSFSRLKNWKRETGKRPMEPVLTSWAKDKWRVVSVFVRQRCECPARSTCGIGIVVTTLPLKPDMLLKVFRLIDYGGHPLFFRRKR